MNHQYVRRLSGRQPATSQLRKRRSSVRGTLELLTQTHCPSNCAFMSLRKVENFSCGLASFEMEDFDDDDCSIHGLHLRPRRREARGTSGVLTGFFSKLHLTRCSRGPHQSCRAELTAKYEETKQFPVVLS
eukprot:scaffold329877_cov40-Prasinocladus_malaysianus.AAC.1